MGSVPAPLLNLQGSLPDRFRDPPAPTAALADPQEGKALPYASCLRPQSCTYTLWERGYPNAAYAHPKLDRVLCLLLALVESQDS
jgi:hypothetical protein